jgi:hypothetical protein
MASAATAGVLTLAAIISATALAQGAQCAKPSEVVAIQTAAIQQELMVAALTCNEIARFNEFQRGFGPELRASDATLARMFKRLYGARRGEAEYHSFKTRLANDSSMRSIHDNPGYCQEAGNILSSALVANKPRLAEFAASVQVVERGPVDSCEVRVASQLPDAGEKPAPVHKHRKRH